MRQDIQLARMASTDLEGDLNGLLRRLGSGWSLVAFEAGAEVGLVDPVLSREELASRVAIYQQEVLLRHELPAIYRAFHHASRSESRELVEFDQQFGPQMPPAIALASERVGRAQIRRLRPLTDDRVVQRYLRAVDQGQAKAWHTIAFGLTLAVYSVPVLQGMIAFERQSLDGFLEAAARPLGIAEPDRRAIHDYLPSAVAGFVRTLQSESRLSIQITDP